MTVQSDCGEKYPEQLVLLILLKNYPLQLTSMTCTEMER